MRDFLFTRDFPSKGILLKKGFPLISDSLCGQVHAMGVFDERHELSMHMLGMHGCAQQWGYYIVIIIIIITVIIYYYFILIVRL